MYIAFEGIDTVGKSTQINNVSKAFENVCITKEPGGTKLGKKIRKIILEEGDICTKTELLLFLADRAEHTAKIIKPNIDRMILSDRSLISGISYAHIHENIDIDTLLSLNKFATENILPDIVIFFTIDEETLGSRMASKEHDMIESRGIEYMMKVQKTMEKLIDRLKITSLKINATDPIDAISENIINFIKEYS